jgi:5'-3' exonuclease
MGIKRLNKFLKNQQLLVEYSSFDEYIRHVRSLSPLKKIIIVAIDEGEYHKYKISLGQNAIFGMLNKIIQFLLRETLPIMVFGGTAPSSKSATIINRLKKIQKNKDLVNGLVNQMHYNMPLNNVFNQLEIWKDKHPELTTINVDIENKVDVNQNFNNTDHVDNINYTELDKEIEKMSSEIWFGSNDLEFFEKKIIKSSKNSVTIGSEEIENIKNMLRILNLPFFQAKGEADALCAGLSNLNLIYSCVTNDMDLLPFGCQRIIQIQSNKHVIEIDLLKVLDKLKLDMDQFIDMCVLFGSDYVSYSPRLEPEEIYNMILRLKTIENFIDEYKHIDSTIIIFKDKFINARNLYKNYAQNEVNSINNIINNFKPIISNQINIAKLFQFLNPYLRYCKDQDIKKQYIENSIKTINKMMLKGKFK